VASVFDREGLCQGGNSHPGSMGRGRRKIMNGVTVDPVRKGDNLRMKSETKGAIEWAWGKSE